MAEQPIVVVGAGLGGLAAAVTVAQAGRRVLVLEKERRAGGYAINYTRGGYTFDLALHAVPAAGADGVFRRLLRELGVEGEVCFVKVPGGMHVRLGPDSYVLANDPDELFHFLSSRFPAERRGLMALRRDIERWAPLYFDVVEGRLTPWQTAMRFLPQLHRFLRHTDLPTERYLARFVTAPVLRALLFQPAVFFGHAMAEFPAINFIVMFYLLLLQGMYTVRGGGAVLSGVLERRLRALGGEIRFGTAVERVQVRDGQAVGVRTSVGEEIAARAVICNVAAPDVVNTLVGREHYPVRYVRALGRLPYSLSVVGLQAGLDCTLAQAGVDAYLTTVFPDADTDACMRRQRHARLPEGYSVTAYAAAGAELPGGPGPTVSVIAAVNPAAWLNLTPVEYCHAKRECTEHLLRLLDRSFPHLRRHCRMTDLVTPHTCHRYTGNPDGAIMGFGTTLGVHRPLLTVSRVPVGNLYLAGAWTLRFGGMMQAIASGRAAGLAAARRANG